jgi:uncharacterized protein DUF5916/cellulose/xylan binding protein with CBM9 domain
MHWLRSSNVKVFIVLLTVIGLTYSSISVSSDELVNDLVKNSSVNRLTTQKLPSFAIPHSTKTIKVDGELNDDGWQHALAISLNIVNNPWNNLPSPVNTTAKIIEDGKYLYISFLAEDPNPEDIIGFLGDRDTKWGDDLVGIKLDTFNSRRLNYTFLVNPFGVQNDSIQNEVTGDNNYLWDGIWQSYGKITAQGYQVEIAIPFNILNFEQGDHEKTWAIELVRLYPRNERLRISHMPIDRNNACWICQMPEITGFKQAKIGQNVTLTPFAVASRNDTRDIYNENDNEFISQDNTDTGIDLRWGITPSTLLNATINPDFSTVESDTGQLSVNTTFSLFYDEKRTFFLENSDYFASNYNLVYTRNIADPDYGVKLTGRQKDHSYGIFVTNDKLTNFIVPGNTGSRLVSLAQESQNAAANYRYNVNDNFSVGILSTYRNSKDYYNFINAVDAKYRFDDSNSLLAQLLYSDTDYINQFTGQAFKIDFVHESENWLIEAGKQQLTSGFRADLGFMTKADFKEDKVNIERIFYADSDDFWTEFRLFTKWNSQHNINNEFIEKTQKMGATFLGPMLSTITASYEAADKIGLRQDDSITQLSNNTTRFDESFLDLYADFQPVSRVFIGAGAILGKKIDYSNDRIGDYQELYSFITLYATDHLAFDFYLQNQQLDNDNGYIFTADLIDVRISYQFDVRSYLKLNLVYSDVDRNPDNNPNSFFSKKDINLSSQLIYSYEVNPQTVFFLGYSDNSYQDDDLSRLKRDQRTFFTKISYAWMP